MNFQNFQVAVGTHIVAREPGDRVIVANAIANNEAPLITSDRRINEEYPNAIW